jgi:V/A-type H+-transporting ATPase subunit D
MKLKSNRSELLKIKNKLQLSKKGYSLLKKKYTSLIIEFHNVKNNINNLNKKIKEKYILVCDIIDFASVVNPVNSVELYTYSKNDHIVFNYETQLKVGIKHPKINFVKKDIKSYINFTSMYNIDQSKSLLYEIMPILLKIIEQKILLQKIKDAIVKIKKKVNALNEKIIPELEGGKKQIEIKLEDLEKYNTIIAKIAKSKNK